VKLTPSTAFTLPLGYRLTRSRTSTAGALASTASMPQASLSEEACHRHAIIMPMGAIQVKDVPEELHDALRRRAIQEGMTMADYVLDLIRRDLGLPSRREWLERLATREPVDIEPGVIAEDIRAARAERDAQIDAASAGIDVDAALAGPEAEADDAGRR
jgi:antitoxin FitA